MDAYDLLLFLPLGYAATVAIETPVLLVGLSPRHSFTARLAYGLWLSACTYPIVALVLPLAMAGQPRWAYLAVAETFAPAAECLLFVLADRRARLERGAGVSLRDLAAIVAANLLSFAAGEAWHAL
jgi:hypothetical protein